MTDHSDYRVGAWIHVGTEDEARALAAAIRTLFSADSRNGGLVECVIQSGDTKVSRTIPSALDRRAEVVSVASA